LAKLIQAADLFCGTGGTSTGLAIAAEAIGTANHPFAERYGTSLDALKPSAVIPGKKLDLMEKLATAHSFPKDYIFTGTKSEIVKQIGNSVPVSTASNLCRSRLAA